MEEYAGFLSPIGWMTLAADHTALHCAVFCPPPNGAAPVRNDILRAACVWLEQYFAGKAPTLGGLPLQPVGTPFQQTVWTILREIPYGASTTYGAVASEVARRLGRERMSAQAAGGAIGQNPIAIFIPCHRVIGSNGTLTGYAGGLDRKTYLLQLEQIPFRQKCAPTIHGTKQQP